MKKHTLFIIGKCAVVRITILLKLYKFNAIGIQTPNSFVNTIDKLILKSVWKCKGFRIP